MRSLSLSSVSYAYTSALDVLADVSVELGSGWHGLVGANGSGKTTLLSLIAGDLRADSGSITVPGPVVRCAQVVDVPTADVLGLADAHDPAAYALRGRLALEQEMVERWDTLSPSDVPSRRSRHSGRGHSDTPSQEIMTRPQPLAPTVSVLDRQPPDKD